MFVAHSSEVLVRLVSCAKGNLYNLSCFSDLPLTLCVIDDQQYSKSSRFSGLLVNNKSNWVDFVDNQVESGTNWVDFWIIQSILTMIESILETHTERVFLYRWFWEAQQTITTWTLLLVHVYGSHSSWVTDQVTSYWRNMYSNISVVQVHIVLYISGLAFVWFPIPSTC